MQRHLLGVGYDIVKIQYLSLSSPNEFDHERGYQSSIKKITLNNIELRYDQAKEMSEGEHNGLFWLRLFEMTGS